MSGSAEAVVVPISLLVVPERLLRGDGANRDHTLRLADSEAQLPPIVVHRPTMGVIDGIHRLYAAKARGATEIEVVYFDGSADEAFVFAVRTNMAHGLPLDTADRRRAAARILVSHPRWSDRMIADTAGLSARTVAAIRSGVVDSARTHRLGSDGRVRPLSTAPGRLAAAQIITARPEASLREIAREAGISPGTVRDVRERIRRGDDPVAKRCARPSNKDRSPARHTDRDRAPRHASVDVPEVLQRLGKDPSLRHNEVGRRLLRWLYLHTIDARDCARVVESVPAHNAQLVAELAAECSEYWSRISAALWQQSPDN